MDEPENKPGEVKEIFTGATNKESVVLSSKKVVTDEGKSSERTFLDDNTTVYSNFSD